MVLREILKNDTSAKTQAALSASHDTENAQVFVEKINNKFDSTILIKNEENNEEKDQC